MIDKEHLWHLHKVCSSNLALVGLELTDATLNQREPNLSRFETYERMPKFTQELIRVTSFAAGHSFYEMFKLSGNIISHEPNEVAHFLLVSLEEAIEKVKPHFTFVDLYSIKHGNLISQFIEYMLVDDLLHQLKILFHFPEIPRVEYYAGP